MANEISKLLEREEVLVKQNEDHWKEHLIEIDALPYSEPIQIPHPPIDYGQYVIELGKCHLTCQKRVAMLNIHGHKFPPLLMSFQDKFRVELIMAMDRVNENADIRAWTEKAIDSVSDNIHGLQELLERAEGAVNRAYVARRKYLAELRTMYTENETKVANTEQDYEWAALTTVLDDDWYTLYAGDEAVEVGGIEALEKLRDTASMLELYDPRLDADVSSAVEEVRELSSGVQWSPSDRNRSLKVSERRDRHSSGLALLE